MEMPKSYTNLSYRNRVFIDCYLNDSLVEPQTNMHTFNDKLIAYIFANNIKPSEFMKITFWLTDPFGKVHQTNVRVANCNTNVKITNAKRYMQVLSNSTKTYNKCLQAINDIRMLLYSSEDKSRINELKDAIYNSAIRAQDFKDRNDNRKMAMKIFGLDQVKVDVSADIYSASGKQIFGDMRKALTNDDDAPLVPDDIDELAKDLDKDD